MAIIRMKQMREMSEKDMTDKMKEFKLELAKERASSEIGTVKNPGRIGELRRTIARMNTILAQRAAKAAAAKPAEKKGVSPEGKEISQKETVAPSKPAKKEEKK